MENFRIGFLQILVPSYKLPMFQCVAALAGIDLTLFAGDRGPAILAKGSPVNGLKHIPLQNKLFQFGPFSIIWQKGLQRLLKPEEYDLVLLPEGVLYLSNYMVMLRCLIRRVPFGFYGHGFNHQRRGSLLSCPLEALRKMVHRLASIMVVYSDEGARHLIDNRHIAPERVFVATNTMDTQSIAERVAALTPEDIQVCRQSLKVSSGGVLLAYIGRIEPIKNPGWVLEAVRQLREKGLPVNAVFVGTGSLLPMLKEQIAKWSSPLAEAVTFVGNLPVDQVDRYLASSDICVMPGMTGLAVVHAFAAGKPYVTIESPHHSPEIAYLRDGENGFIAKPSQDEFINILHRLVQEPELRCRLGECGLRDALSELSMAAQVQGFRHAFDYLKNQTNSAGADP
jgi:glycosyltransferase involved in cell wall biosynthesis